MTRFLSVMMVMISLSPWAAFAKGAGVLTKAPQVLEAVQAEYPADAQAAGITGDVILEIDISEKGEVGAAQVIQSLGHGLDEAALAAAKRLRFSPAEIDEKPAPVGIEYRFHFEMKAPPSPEPGANTAPSRLSPVNFRGKIVERGSKVPLAGALIDINDGSITANSDANGHFEVAGVPVGTAKILVFDNSHVKFETTEIFEEGKAVEVAYFLYRTPQNPFEDIVFGKREKKEVSTVAISSSEIGRIAGVSGDTIKVVQNLPGSSRTSFTTSGLVLRGGNPSDTLFYIDGIEVPMIFHFASLTSVFSNEFTKEVEYEPGNFGVHYGRATAGRVEVKSRDPNSKQLHLLADINVPFHTTLMVEGPVSETLSVAIAARRSYIDAVLGQVKKLDDDGTAKFSLAPRYYDYQGKLVWTPDKINVLRLSFYGSDDRMGMVGIKESVGGLFDGLDIKNKFWRAVLHWDHKFNSDTRMKLSLSGGYNNAVVHIGNLFRKDADSWTVSLRTEATHDFGKELSLGMGLDGQWMRSNVAVRSPPIGKANQIMNVLENRTRTYRLDNLYHDTAPGLWAEAVFKPIENLSLIPGLRFDYDSYMKSTSLDPRFTARWTVSEDTTFKGGAGLYHRNPEFAYTTKEYGNPDLDLEGSRQYSIGLEQKIWGPITLDIQGYYKDLFDLAEPSNGRVVRDGETEDEHYNNSGTGKAYGTELLLRYHHDGRFSGWLAYTFSKTKRDSNNIGGRLDETGDKYDQPHNLTALGTFDLPEVWEGLSAGFRLRYGSGNPYRPVHNAIYDSDGGYYSRVPSSENSRLPDFFQLDLRIDKKWTFPLWAFSAYVECQNVTNRKNAGGINYNFDFTKTSYSEEFPNFILPSMGLRFEY